MGILLFLGAGLGKTLPERLMKRGLATTDAQHLFGAHHGGYFLDFTFIQRDAFVVHAVKGHRAQRPLPIGDDS